MKQQEIDNYKKLSQTLKAFTTPIPKLKSKEQKPVNYLDLIRRLNKTKIKPVAKAKTYNTNYKIARVRELPQELGVAPHVIHRETVVEKFEINPQEIVEKLNTLNGVLNSKVLTDLSELKLSDELTNKFVEEIIKQIKSLKGNDRIDISNIRNGEQLARLANQNFNMNDQRWHGSGGGSSVSTTWYQDEVPDGLKNNANTTFTLLHTPESVCLVYLNGQYQVGGGEDYTRTGNTIEMVVAPFDTDTLIATYS